MCPKFDGNCQKQTTFTPGKGQMEGGSLRQNRKKFLKALKKLGPTF